MPKAKTTKSKVAAKSKKPQSKSKRSSTKAQPAKTAAASAAGATNGKTRGAKQPSADLEALRAKANEAVTASDRANQEAGELRQRADEIAAAGKKALVEALRPYREACRKAGVECEFLGARAANKTPAVRFLVEKASGGIKVAIKGRPETEEVISKKTLGESIGKAAFGYTDRWLGPRSEIGAKGAGLSNRLRAVLAKS